jgi:hypothetical protein
VGKKKCPKWIKECWEAHSGSVSEIDVAVDLGDLDTEWSRCWCCGHETSRLQKCHIIPASLGGNNSASNLLPLCSLCHDESPDVNDPLEMFQWIKQQQNPLSGIGLGRYWHLSDLLLKLSDSIAEDFNYELFQQCLEKACDQSSFHCSQSGAGIKMKKTTREWMLNKAFDFYEQKVNRP